MPRPTVPEQPRDPDDPAYNWPTQLDATIAAAGQYGMRVLIQVVGTPGWANGDRGLAWAPRRKRDLANFMAAAARRYPSVRHWMIWGEPQRAAIFQPLVPHRYGTPVTKKQAAAPRRYARLLDASYAALKRVRRSNVVIGGNSTTAGDIRPRVWVRHMRLPNGKPPRMDVYGHNPFCLRAPDLDNPPGSDGIVDFSDLGRFQNYVSRHLARPRRQAPAAGVPVGMDDADRFPTASSPSTRPSRRRPSSSERVSPSVASSTSTASGGSICATTTCRGRGKAQRRGDNEEGDGESGDAHRA